MENHGSIGEGDTGQIKGKTILLHNNIGKRWHRFRVLTPCSFILRGSRAMSDRRFKYKSRGRQAAPCAIVAIVYGRLFEPKEWTSNHIDQVLEYGDKLFRVSLRRKKLKDDEYMRTNLIHNEFDIGFYKIWVDIEKNGISGNLFSESVGCSDFAEGLQIFLKNNDSGVITAQGSSVAVWRQPGNAGFLCYNPASCDESGLHHPDGTACLMRFKYINDLNDHLLKNLNWRYDSRYCIVKITLLRAAEVGDGFVKHSSDGIGPPIVRKSVLQSINPIDIDDHEVDCTKPVPKEEKLHKLARIRKEPLSINISNYSIDRYFATELLVNRNNFDTGYSYDDMRVNVPSTFTELPGKIAILHGLTHEGEEIYKGKGGQNVANCIMAIAMKKVHPVKIWERSTLDEILMMGDSLYAKVKSDKPLIKMMTAADLDNIKFEIEDRKQVIDVDLITVTGTITSKVPSVLNLKRALEEFFLLNEEGVIETTSMAVAVWSQDDCYYLFDPRYCDATGIRIREEKVAEKDKKEKIIQKDKKEIGNCCVIRFPDLDSLTALFLRNVDPTKRNDRFTIRHVTIVDDVPGTRAWNEFQPGMAGKTWVLQGEISNVDELFEEENQGNQGLAMPIVALVSANETPAAKWSKETVDEVIREGDVYYNWSKPAKIEEEIEKLFLKDMKKNLYFKNRKVTIDINEAAVVGDLSVSDDSELPNLEKGLKQFFEDKNYGIVETKTLSVAVWKEEEETKDKDKEEIFYYYFDPNPRDKLGQLLAEKAEENLACLVRSSDLSALADLIKKNAGYNEGENDFTIHELKIVSIGPVMTDEEIEADQLIPIVPNLNNYSNLFETGAILLGTIDQRNELAFKPITRDKQQAANALATLAMTKLYDPHLWHSELIDDILKIGDKLTNQNLINLPEIEPEEETPRNYLLPAEIAEDFIIGVNRMSVVFEEEVITGNVTDVITLLEQFFEENSIGVFRQDDVMMPIWKEGGVFFTMDPRGRNAQGEPKEDGAAAVMWFTDIPSLANILRAVVREVDSFVIDAITIDNVYETRVAQAERVKKTTSGEDLWHHFPKIADGIWSINGNVTITDERFDEANRGKQSAAIAAMAIVFSKVYQPRQWTPSILDEVIVTGDKLHSKCIERLGSGSELLVNEIINEFFLSSRRIALTIKDCVQAGSLTGKAPKVQDLRSGIDNFFNKYEAGVLTVQETKNLAIWKADDAYYVVIPNWSSAKEIVSTVPRVIRFKDTSFLVDYLLRHLGTEGDYEITAIDVLDWTKPPLSKLDPSPAIRPANLPPLNAYRKLRGEARAILRGSYHQGDKIFPETLRGRQTAANCVVALGMSIVKSPVTWTKKTMDEILAIGINVHQETRKIKPESRLKPKDIIRVFYVGVNVLTADIEPNTVIGLVAIEPSDSEDIKQKETKVDIDKREKRTTQRERSLPSSILLEEGLRKFFEDNRAGILITDRGMIAIWKDLGVYFMYDPRARNDQGLPDSNGTSCIMWFACLEPLYDTIFANIDPRERYGAFEICRVIIRNVIIETLPCPGGFRPYLDRIAPLVPIISPKKTITLNVEPLNEYSIVDNELSILHGSLHMNHRTFSLRNRGLQSTAIAAVAIVMGLLHVPSTWTSELIDTVLKYGDSLYLESARAARPGARNLSPSELLTVFIVGDLRVTIHVHNHTTAGILHIFDLSEALAMFFRANCAGILHTANLAMAVMQHYGKFYMFDPCSRNGRGRPAYDGAACMFKCKSIARMAKIFMDNCNSKRPSVYTLNAVNVLSLHFFSTTRDVCSSKY
ncbi:hypothetical protein ALC56_06584 [Trachymyrmex septentrionalis]|uniref:Uncharacterized protein n=1 Tax=Trachymyrmex septentrionalis TaxID=34720 RepID=A0A195FFJ7_9HYME|nr:PREDICTED: uncharacterized protein LOC108748706 isoform X1 [Trachymyrmex septentrionalis]KYN39158.1 hypothetical protein ALC56_06584 [Trachymyrmex septentrionalis]